VLSILIDATCFENKRFWRERIPTVDPFVTVRPLEGDPSGDTDHDLQRSDPVWCPYPGVAVVVVGVPDEGSWAYNIGSSTTLVLKQTLHAEEGDDVEGC